MALLNRNIVSIPHPSDPRRPVDIVGWRVRAVVMTVTLALVFALVGTAGASTLHSPSPIGPTDIDGGEMVDRAPAPMTREATEQVIGGFFEALEAGSFSRYFAADAVLSRDECGEPVVGRLDVTAAISGVCHGAFAGELTVHDAIVGAGWAAVKGTVFATQVEPFNGVAPSGRLLVVPYSAFYELAGGQIVRATLTIPMDMITKQLTWPDVSPPNPSRLGQAY